MEEEKSDPNSERSVATNSSSLSLTRSTSVITLSQTKSSESQLNQSLNEIIIEENNRNLSISSVEVICRTNVYQMQSKPRGFCVIINNVDFLDNKHPKRVGSDEECKRLNHIFTRLHFDVLLRKNETKIEMLKTLRLIAKHSDLKKHDCLVVIILSHGNSGQIITSDNEAIEFEKVLTIFNNQNCHQMIKKPKMFFFNCCRGSTLDFGPNISAIDMNEEDNDVADAILWPHVPIMSDMMVCYSTIDGYVSWRNEQDGTWFGSALANALESNAHVLELNQILTKASETVHNRTTRNGAKQAIEWKYRAWTKSLYFNPNYFEQSK